MAKIDSADTTPHNEEVDNSLLPDPAAQADAEQAWNDGTKLAEDPVGVFTCVIKNVTVQPSKSSGRLQVGYELEIVGGEHAGRTVRKFDGLGSPEQVKIAQDSMKALGLDPTKIRLDQLPATMLTVEGKTVEVEGKMNGQYYNIYFRRGTPAKSGTAKRSF